MTLVLEIALGIILAVVALRAIGAFIALLVYNEIFRGVVLGVPLVIVLLWAVTVYHPHY
jgi:galactitol-specific phosphotransferase system IIC component